MTQPPLYPIEPRAVELPSPLWLDNGAELNVVPITDAGVVRISVMFKGGRWVEQQTLQSTLAAEQIAAGTDTMSADVLSEKLDFHGATLSAVSGIQSLVVTATCMKRALPQVLPLLTDIITRPAYEQPLIDIEKDELMFACKANRQNVTYVGKKLLQKCLLGERHPLAAAYDERDVAALTREAVTDYHHRHVHMENAIIYASGDVDDTAASLINKHLGKRSGAAHEPTMIGHADILTSSEQRHDTFIETETAQSALYMGCLLPTRLSPDYPAIALTRTILGGYFGSRLMTNIRERLGLTYGISADILHIPESALMIISTTTPYEHVDRCVEEVFKEIALLSSEPTGDEEMQMAKNYLMGQFCRTTELSLSLPSICMSLRESGSSLRDHADMMKRIQQLTAEDVMRCAQTYLRPSSMTIAAAHGKRGQ